MKVTKGHYLSPELKELKSDIMDGLMSSMFGVLEDNQEKLNDQSAMDIILSCLIMFSREVLVRMIVGSGDVKNLDVILNSYMTETIKQVGYMVTEYVKNDGASH